MYRRTIIAALWRIVCTLLAIACMAVPPALADDTTSPVGGWSQRLDRFEGELRKLAPQDSAGRERLVSDLTLLRRDISSWLGSYPPAQQAEQTWLETLPAAISSVEDVAAEIGRLRAAVSRVTSALQQGGEGAFYLGRVDVAVTAETRMSATTEITPAGAAVIDIQQVEGRDRASLSAALALAPGVTFARVGQRNETTVYVRGFDIRQVPLFIDGIPVYTPYDGYADLERFTTFDTAELRISKGFTSVLYGPNALGGAINIVSRRPSERLQGTVGLSAGSGPSRSAYTNLGSRVGRWYVQGSASYLKQETFPLAGGFVAVKTQPAGDRLNADKRDAKGSLKVGWTPNGSDEYAVSYVVQRGKKGNPPYAGTDPLAKPRYWQWPNWDKDSLYFVSNTRLGANSYVRGRAYYDIYNNTLHAFDDATYTTMTKSSSFKSEYHDDTVGGSVEFGTVAGRHTLRAAGHVKKDNHRDHNIGDPEKLFVGYLTSIGVEDTVTLSSRLSLVGGVSFDRQTTSRADDVQKGQIRDLIAECATTGSGCGTSSGLNPQAGVFYSMPSGLLRVTVARKTRMPSLKDRYSYKLGTAVPNPDLKPEHALTVEAGYQGALGTKTSFHASAFYSRLDDLMQRFYLEPNLTQQRNIGRASSSGLEIDARTMLLPRVDLGANYTYLKRENISDPAAPLLDTPRHKGMVSVLVTPVSSVRVMASLDLESGRQIQTDGGTYLEAPSFATMSLKGVWTVWKGIDAEVGVLNLFDRFYWVSEGYPEPGRVVVTNIRWRF